jgi:carbon monoxide dehydrogenase subunit G
MIVEGSSRVDAPREQLWALLSDPARLADALPGVESVDVESAQRFSALARPSTALGETRIAMDFEITDQRPGEYVRISGSGYAGESLVSFVIELELADAGEQTAASWRADIALRGVLSSLLQRGLAPLLNQQVEEVLEAGAHLSRAGGS